ncbi:MAG: ATP-binding protein [Bacteroidota bacterium]|nr:ATP-binding protein [Bacteroidota bacterium]
MHDLIKRNIEDFVFQNLKVFPAVALLGPRQCGKSTLAKMLSDRLNSFLYLDLQNPADLNKLSDPNLFFEANQEATICFDEIQLMPELFSVLRSNIDQNRRNGRFILLGSASRDLIKQTSESLAGRIGLIELSPFSITEINQTDDFHIQKFWMRGGYPDSYLSENDDDSKLWRENFIRTYMERDIPQLGLQIPALQLRRMLSMCAHNQAQLLNSSKFGESLGLTHPTIRRYIDLLEQTFILRTLQPFEPNIKKRLVKSPKIYIRDSGILHRLLQIDSFNDLMGNPIFGASWEGLVIENILSNLRDWSPCFYRTATGDEIDLILTKGNKILAVECKASTAPQLTKGFWKALEDVQAEQAFVIAPVPNAYPIKENVTVCGINDFLKILQKSE